MPSAAKIRLLRLLELLSIPAVSVASFILLRNQRVVRNSWFPGLRTARRQIVGHRSLSFYNFGMMKNFFIFPVLLSIQAFSVSMSSVHANEMLIPSTLECSALSISPDKFPKFTRSLRFSFANNSFTADRSWTQDAFGGPGREVFSGSLNRDKTITITGRGAYDNGRSSWRYETFGSLKATDLTILKGSLTSYGGGAKRDCSISFLLPPAKLNNLLVSSNQPASASSPQLEEQEKTKKQFEDIAKDLAERQNQLQVAQDALKRQRAEAERDFIAKQDQLRAVAVGNSNAAKDLIEQQKAIKEQQEKQAQAAKNLEDQRKTMDAEHQALIQEQTKTSKDVSLVQNILGGIILPLTEDPKSWMMRVASVPVQQQQFCRIVDRFYDNLAKVYQAHNDIKKNSLFRDRKEDMATLLPRGEFENWVVQIKEVVQAPDGSAAVMLQPPCRAMLGSDACQKNDSKIRATIPIESPLYRELSKVSAGDFVIVSGKILYAGSINSTQPLPAFAVYQAGSHCSAVEETKQEDVFVTEISYLVPLR